jgi:rod shape determining protein RodA
MAFLEFKWSRHGATVVEWQLILVSLVLSIMGLFLIFSATSHSGEAERSLVVRQATWCGLGLVLMSLCLFFDYHLLERWSLWLYIGIIAALIAVWALGKVTAGSRRWIEIGFLRFQPSEFAKLAVVIVMAKFLQHRRGIGDRQIGDLVRPILFAALPMVLVLIQPDLGTAVVIFLIAISMILFAGVGRRVLLWAGGTLLAMIPIAILLGDRVLLEYQKKRLLTFLNPSYDPLGSGYHIIQSQIAIGSGGIYGKGYLQGTQNQLMFLPVKHTDFIFSILAEEWGFLGCAVVLILFSALVLRGMTIAKRAKDDFGTLIAFGCTVAVFWHVVINVGMVMGLLPVVGVPLSFVSYGGSSLLASFLAISFLANVSMRRFPY